MRFSRFIAGLPWRIGDLIDLEYFFLTDEPGNGPPPPAATDAAGPDDRPDGDRTQRDRELFLRQIAPGLPADFREPAALSRPAARRRIIRHWVELRRGTGGASPKSTPGMLYADTRCFFLAILFLIPLLSGAGLASSLLLYTGREPLNISVYLGVLILPQLLWLFLLLLYSLAAGTDRRGGGGRLPHGVLARTGFQRLMKRFAGSADRPEILNAERRMTLEAASGFWKRLDRIYGGLLRRPFFVLLQWAGVWFNMGILAATLLRVTGTDLAFGWQSTLEIGPEAVHRAVEWISAPWASWIPASLAPPDLEAVRGSRIILKEGMHHLATPDLTAWWPFLCSCVAVYGLLPRLLLLLAGWAGIRWRLARLPLAHGDCDRLLARMLSPGLKTGGRPDHAPGPSGGADFPDLPDAPDSPGLPAAVSGPLAVLMPADMNDDLTGAALASLIRERFHRDPEKILPLGPLPSDTRRSMAELPDFLNASGGSVLILQEAWQPPIQETLRLFRDLRVRVGDTCPVGILLAGRPRPPGTDAPEADRVRPCLPVADEHRRIWQRRIASLGDPWLFIEELERRD